MRETLCVLLISCTLILISAPAACQQEQKLTEPGEERLNARQPPDQVTDAIGVKQGMVIGEIGAGRGRYTVHLATKVGDEGKIYANDIDQRALEYLKQRCVRNKIENVETILGDVENPKFPNGSLDMAFMISVFHHLEKPVELLKNIAPALKPGAVLVIVEYDSEKPNTHPGSSTSKEQMLDIIDEAGYEKVRIETFLIMDNIYILRLKSPEN